MCSLTRLCAATAAPQRQCSVARSAFVIEAKQNAKQRIRLSEKHRMYNKARKSAIATRMKKVTCCTCVIVVYTPQTGWGSLLRKGMAA